MDKGFGRVRPTKKEKNTVKKNPFRSQSEYRQQREREVFINVPSLTPEEISEERLKFETLTERMVQKDFKEDAEFMEWCQNLINSRAIAAINQVIEDNPNEKIKVNLVSDDVDMAAISNRFPGAIS